MAAAAADHLLHDLGHALGLELAFDEAGLCRLVVDRQWHVGILFDAGRDHLVLTCPLHTPQADTLDPAWLLLMLKGNCTAIGGVPATLSVAPDGFPCAQADIPVRDTGLRTLMRRLEQLLEVAQAWSTRLSQPPGDAASVRKRPQPRLMA
ncbi:type III secretion system chaperone [Ramlibacter sp. AW1]|uniref:Type III secretion system chaperone n=1 Tax=Ramlibacter aurantiacus TaxID=2801330 RepID=A0A937D3Q0_9BURK|nr:type III secretion system chaperone [Ramlibacter aurantiacus]MBL0420950.1 type III secretion system chaperone [Ramlibacter aurantiacus]